MHHRTRQILLNEILSFDFMTQYCRLHCTCRTRVPLPPQLGASLSVISKQFSKFTLEQVFCIFAQSELIFKPEDVIAIIHVPPS